MNYKEETIKELRELFYQYRNKKMNKKTIFEINEIINNENQFRNNMIIKIKE